MTPDQLSQILDTLGQKLGPAGEHIFALAVREQYIEGIISLILLAVTSFLLLSLLPVYRWAKKAEYHSDRDFAAFAYGLVVTMVFALFFINAIFGIQKLLNPEWAAISTILSSVSGSK